MAVPKRQHVLGNKYIRKFSGLKAGLLGLRQRHGYSYTQLGVYSRLCAPSLGKVITRSVYDHKIKAQELTSKKHIISVFGNLVRLRCLSTRSYNRLGIKQHLLREPLFGAGALSRSWAALQCVVYVGILRGSRGVALSAWQMWLAQFARGATASNFTAVVISATHVLRELAFRMVSSVGISSHSYLQLRVAGTANLIRWIVALAAPLAVNGGGTRGGARATLVRQLVFFGGCCVAAANSRNVARHRLLDFAAVGKRLTGAVHQLHQRVMTLQAPTTPITYSVQRPMSASAILEYSCLRLSGSPISIRSVVAGLNQSKKVVNITNPSNSIVYTVHGCLGARAAMPNPLQSSIQLCGTLSDCGNFQRSAAAFAVCSHSVLPVFVPLIAVYGRVLARRAFVVTDEHPLLSLVLFGDLPLPARSSRKRRWLLWRLLKRVLRWARWLLFGFWQKLIAVYACVRISWPFLKPVLISRGLPVWTTIQVYVARFIGRHFSEDREYGPLPQWWGSRFVEQKTQIQNILSTARYFVSRHARMLVWARTARRLGGFYSFYTKAAGIWPAYVYERMHWKGSSPLWRWWAIWRKLQFSLIAVGGCLAVLDRAYALVETYFHVLWYRGDTSGAITKYQQQYSFRGALSNHPLGCLRYFTYYLYRLERGDCLYSRWGGLQEVERCNEIPNVGTFSIIKNFFMLSGVAERGSAGSPYANIRHLREFRGRGSCYSGGWLRRVLLDATNLRCNNQGVYYNSGIWCRGYSLYGTSIVHTSGLTVTNRCTLEVVATGRTHGGFIVRHAVHSPMLRHSYFVELASFLAGPGGHMVEYAGRVCEAIFKQKRKKRLWQRQAAAKRGVVDTVIIDRGVSIDIASLGLDLLREAPAFTTETLCKWVYDTQELDAITMIKVRLLSRLFKFVPDDAGFFYVYRSTAHTAAGGVLPMLNAYNSWLASIEFGLFFTDRQVSADCPFVDDALWAFLYARTSVRAGAGIAVFWDDAADVIPAEPIVPVLLLEGAVGQPGSRLLGGWQRGDRGRFFRETIRRHAAGYTRRVPVIGGRLNCVVLLWRTLVVR